MRRIVAVSAAPVSTVPSRGRPNPPKHDPGDGWRELLGTAGPDALDLAVRDTKLFYRAEAPSLGTWTLDETRAATVQSRCCR